uniref:Secreted protein n=1 Tax=Ascaris lumbricoides TaxID=6252 RepID=A0A0M3IX46_ASCLU
MFINYLFHLFILMHCRIMLNEVNAIHDERRYQDRTIAPAKRREMESVEVSSFQIILTINIKYMKSSKCLYMKLLH